MNSSLTKVDKEVNKSYYGWPKAIVKKRVPEDYLPRIRMITNVDVYFLYVSPNL